MALFDSAPTTSRFVDPKGFIERVWMDFLKKILNVSTIIQDTRANRASYPASDYPNTIFRETDSTLEYISTGTAWIYRAGAYQRTQSQIAALVAVLGTNDAGLLIEVTDFTHTMRWSGTALAFAPGDDGSNYFIDAPSAPLGKTVQLCDGTAVTYLLASGATASYTTKNLTGHYRKSVVAAADALVAAVTPLITGSVAATTPTNQVASAGITVDTHASHTHDDASSLTEPDLFAADVTGAGVAGRTGGPSSALSHNVNDPTHNHTQNSHVHAVGTLVNDALGEPPSFKVLTYFRR